MVAWTLSPTKTNSALSRRSSRSSARAARERSEGTVGDPDVSALYGKVGSKEHGLFVTLGTFSSKAASFAKSKDNLRLIDGEELVELVYQHYERFDSRHKGLLPMRRVYVPEPIDDQGS